MGPVVAEVTRAAPVPPATVGVDTFQNLTRAPTSIGFLSRYNYVTKLDLKTSSQKRLYGNRFNTDLDYTLPAGNHLVQVNAEIDQEQDVQIMD